MGIATIQQFPNLKIELMKKEKKKVLIFGDKFTKRMIHNIHDIAKSKAVVFSRDIIIENEEPVDLLVISSEDLIQFSDFEKFRNEYGKEGMKIALVCNVSVGDIECAKKIAQTECCFFSFDFVGKVEKEVRNRFLSMLN